jgi:hypothetical protein
VLSASSAPVEAEPLTACGPDHAPEAVQEVAFDEVQVSVEATPCATLLGLALNETSGTGVALTRFDDKLQPLATVPIATSTRALSVADTADPHLSTK